MAEEPETGAPQDEEPGEGGPAAAPSGPPPQYWLRVHGYPSDLVSEVVTRPQDFADLIGGRLRGDPAELLRVGDVLIYYADGPASIYGCGTVVDRVQVVEDEGRRTWNVPIKRDALIKIVNKAPHAVGLEPPSGRHFLSLVRDYTYIRLPEADGVYLVGQVKTRAGSKD